MSLLGEVIERPSGPTDWRDPMLHVSDQPARLTALGQEHRTQGMMGNEGLCGGVA